MLLASALAMGCCAVAPAQPRACQGAPVRIEHASEAEAELACDGARAAFGFLALPDLNLPEPLWLELSDQLPKAVSQGAAGYFERHTHRIVVLHYEKFAQQQTWLGLPIEAEVYRSIFAHEVAHAIATSHAGEHRLSPAAQEYAAHVTMLATASPALRERILAQRPGNGFDREHQINELIYALDPQWFAVESYRHWLRQPDPAAFLRRVLDGAAIPGLESGS